MQAGPGLFTKAKNGLGSAVNLVRSLASSLHSLVSCNDEENPGKDIEFDQEEVKLNQVGDFPGVRLHSKGLFDEASRPSPRDSKTFGPDRSRLQTGQDSRRS